MAIAVMLADMPQLLRDALTASLGSQPDLRVLGDGAPGEPLDARLTRFRPDVLIVAFEDGEPPHRCAASLSRFPRMKVFALEALGRRVSLYELRPTVTRLGPLSAGELADAIRRALGPMPIVGVAGVTVDLRAASDSAAHVGATGQEERR